MAKSKSKKPLLRARPKRTAKPSAKAKAPVKKVKPAARGAKRPAAKAKVAKAKTARKPSAKSAAARGAKAAKPASAKTKAKPVAGAQAKATSPLAVAKPRPPQIGRDWSKTLFLPKTDFPMKAGLPEREPELLKRWQRVRLYEIGRASWRVRV